MDESERMMMHFLYGMLDGEEGIGRIYREKNEQNIN